ncbi:MAG: hypothetical protein WC794_04970 [Candidatus Doudnabacteria bacterium]
MEKYNKVNISDLVKSGEPKQKFKISNSEIKLLENIAQVILAVTVMAGAITISAVAPNLFQILDKVPWRKKTYSQWNTKRDDQRRKIARTFYYLKNKGYVTLEPSGENFTIKITGKGQKQIDKMQFRFMQIKRAQKWDGHWWLALADIPSNPYRHNADLFRQKVKRMGLYPLQRTVWVYPFDPREEVGFASAYYKVEKFVTVMEVVSLDQEDLKKLKDYFKEKSII